jgi:hypothetical protein
VPTPQAQLKSDVGKKFQVAFGALAGSVLELDQTLAESSETCELADIDLLLMQRAQAHAAAALERRPAMLATLPKLSKEARRGEAGVRGGGAAGHVQTTRLIPLAVSGGGGGGGGGEAAGDETVNSLGTVLAKGCTSRMREFAQDRAGNQSDGNKGGGSACYLSLAQLLHSVLPSSMRLRTLERECLSLRVQIAMPTSRAGWRSEPLSQRLFLVVALGEDVRVRKLVEMKTTEEIEFVFDGVLAEHTL